MASTATPLTVMSDCSYNRLAMRVKRSSAFEDFYADLREEAEAEGPAAVADLRAKEIKYALVNTLITRRQDLNLSQERLAEASGVAQTEISRIERGRKSPTLDTFSRLVSALRMEVLPASRSRSRAVVAFAAMMSAPKPVEPPVRGVSRRTSARRVAASRKTVTRRKKATD